MSMRYEKKPAAKRNGGVYIAVALCCAAICLAAWSSVVVRGGKAGDAAVQPEAAANGSTLYTGTAPTQPAVEFVSTETQDAETQDIETQNIEMQSTETQEVEMQGVEEQDSGEPEDAVEVSAEPAVYMMPVINGELIKGFSAGALVYCSTMGDWRVHEGVDVACEEGADLYCACSGRVYATYEDVLYGNTAIVEHEDGSMLYYCGLEDFSRLSQGMELKTGDLMGQVGTVPCEADDGPHIHLAYMRDGGYTEPLSAMGIK